ncbi:MAG: hypothetical protein Q9170_004834 [Blastenia crenularia]
MKSVCALYHDPTDPSRAPMKSVCALNHDPTDPSRAPMKSVCALNHDPTDPSRAPMKSIPQEPPMKSVPPCTTTRIEHQRVASRSEALTWPQRVLTRHPMSRLRIQQGGKPSFLRHLDPTVAIQSCEMVSLGLSKSGNGGRLTSTNPTMCHHDDPPVQASCHVLLTRPQARPPEVTSTPR